MVKVHMVHVFVRFRARSRPKKVSDTAGRKLAKQSREDKREETRRLILDEAMDLFFEKGYEETTTRDILLRTGLLNGSLYNRFKSKEEILLAIVSECLGEMSDAFEREFSDRREPLLAFAAPGAILLYISSHSSKAASLIYSASHSLSAVDMYLEFYRHWTDVVFGQSVILPSDGSAMMKISAIIGVVSNICGRYAEGSDVTFNDAFRIVVNMVSPIADVPKSDLGALCDKVSATMDSMDINVLGHNLRDFPDYH